MRLLALVFSFFLFQSAFAIESIPASPEIRVSVSVGNIQVIRFPNKVLEAYVDASKGIQVQAQGNNLLIKWNPYYRKPAVIAVTTEDENGNTHDYSVIAVPDRKKPEVVEIFIPKEVKVRKKAAYYERSMPYEELLVTLTRQFMSGNYPDYYVVKPKKELLGLFAEIEVWQTAEGVGDRFKVLKGYIKNVLNNQIRIDETVLSFLSKRFDVRSISVRHHVLNPGETTTFVVVVGRK